MKRTPIKRTSTKFQPSRKPLKPQSAKKRAEAPIRREVVEAVWERDRQCQWPVLQARYLESHPSDAYLFRDVPPCDSKQTAHEPAHRRNVDYLDPDSAIAACWVHNSEAEGSFRRVAELIGFVVRGNGNPLKKDLLFGQSGPTVQSPLREDN